MLFIEAHTLLIDLKNSNCTRVTICRRPHRSPKPKPPRLRAAFNLH